MSDSHDLVTRARSLAERIVANRRAIHCNPELGLQNPETQQLILAELERIGVDRVAVGKSVTSVVAEIDGLATSPGRAACVALRADMDALPLTENADVPFVSKNEGRMHACGHDTHVAMLLGAAEVLAGARASFAGTVRLLFQPGEEGYGGAAYMIREGALDGVDEAFAIHVDSSLRPGTVALRGGPIMVAADTFVVSFNGKGGHASMPHLSVDPIPAIGPFVDGLSHIAARETDPDDRAVLSVTKVDAGTAFNVVPSTATCAGTIRTISPKGRAHAHERLRRVADGVAAARGLTAEVKIVEGYPPTVNHAEVVDRVEAVASGIGLPIHRMPSPVMGAEDFSYVLEKLPGAIVFLGCSVKGGGPLHSDKMRVDEDALPLGAALHAAVAVEALGG